MTSTILLVAVVVLGVVLLAWGRPRARGAMLGGVQFAKVGTKEADAATLKALRDAGSDLTRPTHARFYLYFPSEELARRASEAAETPTLKASVDEGAEEDTWLCLLEGELVPTLETIHGETVRLTAIAESLGGDYDGWEAAVQL